MLCGEGVQPVRGDSRPNSSVAVLEGIMKSLSPTGNAYQLTEGESGPLISDKNSMDTPPVTHLGAMLNT